MRTMTLAAAVLALPLTLGAQASYVVRAENTLTLARADETIGLAWADVRTKTARRVADTGARARSGIGPRGRVAGRRQ